jgi:pullulanase
VVLGRFQPGNPPSLAGEAVHNLALVAGMPDLWSRSAADCGLIDREVYHYWFEVTDSRPGGAGAALRRTDPAATTVDWRLLSPLLPPPYGEDDRWPAAVVMWRGRELVICDPDGGVPDWSQDAPIASLSGNNRTVYYKLPTRWARRSVEGRTQVGVGTFRDVLALLHPDATSVSFRGYPRWQLDGPTCAT